MIKINRVIESIVTHQTTFAVQLAVARAAIYFESAFMSQHICIESNNTVT